MKWWTPLLVVASASCLQAARLDVRSFGPDLTRATTSDAHVLKAMAAQQEHVSLFLTKPSQESPLHIAKAFLAKHVKMQTGFGFVVKNENKDDVSGVSHIYFKQTLNGVEVVNGDANIHIDRFGRVFSFSSSFFLGKAPEAPEAEVSAGKEQWVLAQPSATVGISASEAVVALAKHLKLEAIPAPSSMIESMQMDFGDGNLFPGSTEDSTAVVEVSNVPFAAEGKVVLTRRYLIVTEPELSVKPVWDVVADMASSDNWFNAQVEATSGSVLQLIDWVHDAKYNVYPIGVNDPSDGQRQLVANPEDAEASPLGWHDQGTSGSKFTVTVGNNVWAQSNPNGRSTYENNYRPTGTGSASGLVFDFPLDLTKAPSTYIDSAIVNLFYWNNIMHDLFYQYGFDEKSGNFQEDNFGRGGKGGDAVVANAQDGSGYNNANFATPPDGQKGRMRMYTWTTSRPNHDGDLEAGIIIHEYGHGISTRLTGGPANSGCLGYGEAGGMGEGWGDTWATMLRMRPEYNSSIVFGMGDYSAGRGIRPYPYSTSMTINPHVYSYIRKPSYGGVHAMGAVWASILYDVYWAVVDEHGFEPDWYSIKKKRVSGEKLAGNLIMMQLLVDGLKLQPCRPTFVDARNAILKADETNFDGEHICLLWKAFAKRGLGATAKAGGIDSFDLPQECA